MEGSPIRLVPFALPLLDAAAEGDDALARALACEVAEGWNGFPRALSATHRAVLDDRRAVEWGSRLFVLDAIHVLVGWGGYKGPPGGDGAVEIGYEIAPGYRGRGLATAAVRALLREAQERGVRVAIAHTLPERNASVRVLEKLGFELEDRGETWRWRYEPRASS